MAGLSKEIKRQIGVIINRRGAVVAVIIGDEREIVIPVLPDYPLGRRLLRGLRCVHTHLKNEPLTQDDLTDLALLRLDLMTAIGVKDDGLPADAYTAHLLPYYPDGPMYDVGPPVPFHSLDTDAESFIVSLEEEMGRAVTRDVSDRRERAILVSVATRPKDEQMESLEELKELARTDQVDVLDMVCQRPERLNPKYLMGTGKIKGAIRASRRTRPSSSSTRAYANADQGTRRDHGLKVIDRTSSYSTYSPEGRTRGTARCRSSSRSSSTSFEAHRKGTSLSRLMGGIGGRGGRDEAGGGPRRVQDRIAHRKGAKVAEPPGSRGEEAADGIPIISIAAIRTQANLRS
ncbi:MAG: hypothetical protein HS130_08830 [Deltaproteobacteria bacterium]|nr:hypothetical protein [Deltaproteobacteria bacterium]